MKPVIHLFTGEYEGGAYRKHLTEQAVNHAVYQNKIKQCLLDTMEYYRALNPEGLQTRNGVKVIRPAWKDKP